MQVTSVRNDDTSRLNIYTCHVATSKILARPSKLTPHASRTFDVHRAWEKLGLSLQHLRHGLVTTCLPLSLHGSAAEFIARKYHGNLETNRSLVKNNICPKSFKYGIFLFHREFFIIFKKI